MCVMMTLECERVRLSAKVKFMEFAFYRDEESTNMLNYLWMLHDKWKIII